MWSAKSPLAPSVLDLYDLIYPCSYKCNVLLSGQLLALDLDKARGCLSLLD